MSRGATILVAGLFGFAAAAIGAFGAHAVKDPQAKAWIETGFRYHAWHVTAVFVALLVESWGGRAARFAPPIFFVGIVLFAGALYALALGAPRAAAMLAPVGGVGFLIGWGVLAFAGLQIAREPRP